MNKIYEKWKDVIDGKISDKVANIIESEKYVKISDEERDKILEKFQNFLNNMREPNPEAAKILEENLWDLI